MMKRWFWLVWTCKSIAPSVRTGFNMSTGLHMPLANWHEAGKGWSHFMANSPKICSVNLKPFNCMKLQSGCLLSQVKIAKETKLQKVVTIDRVLERTLISWLLMRSHHSPSAVLSSCILLSYCITFWVTWLFCHKKRSQGILPWAQGWALSILQRGTKRLRIAFHCKHVHGPWSPWFRFKPYGAASFINFQVLIFPGMPCASVARHYRNMFCQWCFMCCEYTHTQLATNSCQRTTRVRVSHALRAGARTPRSARGSFGSTSNCNLSEDA